MQLECPAALLLYSISWISNTVWENYSIVLSITLECFIQPLLHSTLWVSENKINKMWLWGHIFCYIILPPFIKVIKTCIIMRYHNAPVRLAKIKNTNNANCWLTCKAIRTLIPCWWESKMVYLIWKFFMILNTHFQYDPAISLLGIYSRKMKMYIYTKHVHKCS